jgi:glucose/mannose-6-phosphate isomerase
VNKLDDRKVMAKIDKRQMLEELENFPLQVQAAYKQGRDLAIPAGYKKIDKVLICGMGGSAIIGDLLLGYLKLEAKIPVAVNRDSRLPNFVDERTLVFLISHSGNTKETLHNFHDALKRKAKVVAVTSGGRLKKETARLGLPCVSIQADGLPRASLGLLFFPVLNVLQKLRVISNKEAEVKETLALIKTLSGRWGGGSRTGKNLAKSLARKLEGKIPVLYGANSLMDGVARRWKSQLNENTKLFSSYNIFPEVTHNEIECWHNLKNLRRYFQVLILNDGLMYPEDEKRLALSCQKIGQKLGPVEAVTPYGKSALARLFSIVYLGDFVSVYLAFLYATDPTPMPMIDYIKANL